MGAASNLRTAAIALCVSICAANGVARAQSDPVVNVAQVGTQSGAVVDVPQAGPITPSGEPQRREQRGLIVRSVSLSSGYTSVQLPPITLGGYLPQDILSNDLITTGSADIGWHRGSTRSSYAFDLSGDYTRRARFSEMSALGGSGSFSASHTLGRRWRASVGFNDFVANSDQLSFQQSQPAELASAPSTFQDLASALALARSVRPKDNPDIAQASLFVPITQSLAATQTYGNRLNGGSGTATLSYASSARFSTFASFGYSSVRRIGSSNEPGVALSFPDSTGEILNGGVNYSLSRRSSLTVSILRSKSTGVFDDELTTTTIGYGWSGRKWFTMTTVGVGFSPYKAPPASDLQIERAAPSNRPELTYSVNIGYKTRTQTFLVGQTRGLNDGQGYGALWGKSMTATGAWYWSPPRSKWSVQANLLESRGLGNFLFINTWHGNAAIGRSVNRNVRISGEFLYDRHGSKGFEGFHLTREGFQLGLTWSPTRRLL